MRLPTQRKKKRMSRVGQIIANMPEKMAKAVLHQREIHACLMELDRDKVLALQAKSVYLNFQEGEGRMLDAVPHYYDRSDGKGGSVMVETYFRYINKVH